MDLHDDIAINDALTIYLGTMRFFKIAEYLLQLRRFHIYHREFWDNIEEHTHPYFELLIPVEGNVHYSVGNRHIVIDSSKQIIIIPPATPHTRTVIKHGDTVLVIHFTFENDSALSISDLLKNELEKNFYRLEVKENLPYENIIKLCMERSFLWQDYISNCLEKFFLDIFSAQSEKVFSNNNEEMQNISADTQKNINRFEQMIETTLDTRLSLAEYAEKIGISKRQLERWIRKYHNMTFTEYITRRRFSVAQKLLSDSGYSIKEAADAVGYDNISYFCKIFKQYTGMTPLEYQNKKK